MWRVDRLEEESHLHRRVQVDSDEPLNAQNHPSREGFQRVFETRYNDKTFTRSGDKTIDTGRLPENFSVFPLRFTDNESGGDP